MHINIPIVVSKNKTTPHFDFDKFCYDMEIVEERNQDCCYEAHNIALNYNGTCSDNNFSIQASDFLQAFDETAISRVGEWESGITDPYFSPVVFDGICYNNCDIAFSEAFEHTQEINATVVAVYDAKL